MCADHCPLAVGRDRRAHGCLDLSPSAHLLVVVEAVMQRLASYRPASLTPAQADAALPRLLDLVAAAQPKVAEDVKSLMGAACWFLADVAPDRTSCPADAL
jgi:hypothetical protein